MGHKWDAANGAALNCGATLNYLTFTFLPSKHSTLSVLYFHHLCLCKSRSLSPSTITNFFSSQSTSPTLSLFLSSNLTVSSIFHSLTTNPKSLIHHYHFIHPSPTMSPSTHPMLLLQNPWNPIFSHLCFANKNNKIKFTTAFIVKKNSYKNNLKSQL